MALEPYIANHLKNKLLSNLNSQRLDSVRFKLRFLSSPRTDVEATLVAISLVPCDFQSRDDIELSSRCDYHVAIRASQAMAPLFCQGKCPPHQRKSMKRNPLSKPVHGEKQTQNFTMDFRQGVSVKIDGPELVQRRDLREALQPREAPLESARENVARKCP